MKPGERLQGITFGLVPWGTITGTVIGKDGMPGTGATITAGALNYNDGVRDALFSAGYAQSQTDDRGQYRLFYLGPGDYFVRAEPPGAGNRAG